ncbi:MAG TPA: 3',5'-nucleoside bisphosphate phosphatase [Burkholderiales bacterium]|nr:3',5'-nucleoside bisphosphate phosphatase [Burkholderiales bacterium]
MRTTPITFDSIPVTDSALRHDLHSHSTWSDGVLPPTEVVARAAQRGVDVLALTDHDEVGGLSEARAAAHAAGVRLIEGVEISVTWGGHALHILGLRIDPSNTVLVEGLRTNRAGRTERAERISAGLASIGIPDALEGARVYVTNPELVSRTHFARHLVESGRARNTQAVFDRYLGVGKPGYAPHEWASLENAVEWITIAGGIPVIAHPGRYKMDEPTRRKLLLEFKGFGGIGVEVVTGSHTSEQYGYWARRAAEYDLLASVGSDFHTPHGSYRDLGGLPPLPSGCKPIWELLST